MGKGHRQNGANDVQCSTFPSFPPSSRSQSKTSSPSSSSFLALEVPARLGVREGTDEYTGWLMAAPEDVGVVERGRAR